MFSTKYPNNSRIVSGTPQLYNDDSILLCNTSVAPVIINLLSIPAGFFITTWKLYVVDNSNNASVNNITINAGAGQTVNGAASVTLNVSGGSAVIEIASNTSFLSTFSYSAALGNGHIIQDEGVALPQQPILNFVGPGVTVTDLGGKTVVTIPGINIISLTNAAILVLIAGSTIVPGQLYLITDANLTDGGALVQGVTTNTVTLAGAGLFFVPDYQNVSTNNVGVWHAGLVGLVAGVSITIYEGLQYQSVTGVVGTAPNGDAVNWLLLAKSTANTYILEVDQIRYDVAINRLLYRADKRENEVEYVIYKGENSLVAFQWGNTTGCYGNKVLSSSFIGNINNRNLVNNNIVLNGSAIEAKFVNAFVQNNFLEGTSILVLTNAQGRILRNKICVASSIFLDTHTVAGEVSFNVVESNSILFGASNGGLIINNTLSSKSTLTATNNLGLIGQVMTAFGEVPGNTLVSGNINVADQTATGSCSGNMVTSGGQINIPQNESEIRSCLVHTFGRLSCAINQARLNRNEIGGERSVALFSPNIVAYQNRVADSGRSNFDVVLDLNDPLIYNGGTFTLTIPIACANWAGVYALNNSNKVINNIINLTPNFPTTFQTALAGEITTFNSVAIAGALVGEIIAAQAPGGIIVAGRANGTDDIVMKKLGTFNAVEGRPNIYQ